MMEGTYAIQRITLLQNLRSNEIRPHVFRHEVGRRRRLDIQVLVN